MGTWFRIAFGLRAKFLFRRHRPFVPPRMEDLMCWEMDYKLFDELKKAHEVRIKQEQRG
jgi:hypothetical protein